jgi:hypothetical protein
MIVAALSGCGKPKSESKSEPVAANNVPASEKKEEPIAVATGPGSNSHFYEPTNDPNPEKRSEQRQIEWEIAWQSSNFAVVNEKKSGYMFKVSGKVYENGVPTSSFLAARAEADEATDRLNLDGGIKLTSEKAVMTAKKVEWLAAIKLFKASGDVILDSPNGVVGPVEVLYADAKLKKVASSKEYFKK